MSLCFHRRFTTMLTNRRLVAHSCKALVTTSGLTLHAVLVFVCAFLFQFTRYLLCLFLGQGINAPSWKGAHLRRIHQILQLHTAFFPSPKPSHWNEASLKQAFGPCLCVANLEGRCDGYHGIMVNHTWLDAKPRAASSTIQPVSPPFTQSLDQRPWSFTVSLLHLANCPQLSPLTFSTLFSAKVRQSSTIMEQPRKRCAPWKMKHGDFPAADFGFPGRWQWYHQGSPCRVELSKRPPRSFFLGDD